MPAVPPTPAESPRVSWCIVQSPGLHPRPRIWMKMAVWVGRKRPGSARSWFWWAACVGALAGGRSSLGGWLCCTVGDEDPNLNGTHFGKSQLRWSGTVLFSLSVHKGHLSARANCPPRELSWRLRTSWCSGFQGQGHSASPSGGLRENLLLHSLLWLCLKAEGVRLGCQREHGRVSLLVTRGSGFGLSQAPGPLSIIIIF